jgi:hypothetical protein
MEIMGRLDKYLSEKKFWVSFTETANSGAVPGFIVPVMKQVVMADNKEEARVKFREKYGDYAVITGIEEK